MTWRLSANGAPGAQRVVAAASIARVVGEGRALIAPGAVSRRAHDRLPVEVGKRDCATLARGGGRGDTAMLAIVTLGVT